MDTFRHNPIDYLDTAIALAQAREQMALIAAMIEQLQRILPGYAIQFLDVIPTEPLQVQPTATDVTEPYPADALTQTAWRTQQIQWTETDTGIRALFPMHGTGRIKRVIDIQGPPLVGQQRIDLEKLTILFNHQYLLLEKHEHDPLTSLFNRQAFDIRLHHLIENHRQRDTGKQRQSCLAFLDIDHFKRINDSFGHLYGDEVLILFASFMEKTFRHEDMLFRYGGEEFAVILNNIDLGNAAQVLERYRINIENHPFPMAGNVTVSIGLTEIHPATPSSVLLDRADKALYYSKDNGRNQVNVFEWLYEEGKLEDETPGEGDVELF